MGGTRIKQYDCRLMMNRKYTRHNWCALRKFSKNGKVNLPLPDLQDLLLTLALVVLIIILTWGRLLISGATGHFHRYSNGYYHLNDWAVENLALAQIVAVAA